MKNQTTTNEDARRLTKILDETSRYNDRDLAFAAAGHAVKTLWVMLGDDGKFWVTSPANCAALERMGYEWAD